MASESELIYVSSDSELEVSDVVKALQDAWKDGLALLTTPWFNSLAVLNRNDIVKTILTHALHLSHY